MIIVSGPDNSGKTTLVGEICEQYPNLVPLKSVGPATNYDWWMRVLVHPPEELSNLICDRFFYSEFVYGPLVRGKVSLSPHQQEVIYSMLMSAEPLVIQCHLIENREKFEDRPQIFDWETTLKTEALFDLILGLDVALQYWPLSTPFTRSRHILDRVRNYLDGMDEWQELRTKVVYGRGQMRSPKLMLVGERFSTNNKWKVPFERSKSGIALHNALRATGFVMQDLWFTNAVKTSEPLNPINLAVLKREVELIQPQKVVGLGNRASGLLSALEIEHTKIRHPGWYFRKYRTVEANRAFIEEFAMQMELEFAIQLGLEMGESKTQ